MTDKKHPLDGFFGYEADIRAGRDPGRHIKIPSYQEAIANPDKILEFQSTAGLRFGSWSMFFNDDSVAHPAKMNLRMLEWIIENYSKPGDIIMDMFAGTGSTLIMASRKGRNTIGVELEQHFIDTMIIPNIKTSQSQTLLAGEPGKIVIVKGDSRRLDLIIPQAIDSIITSPPYGTKAFADKQWMIDNIPEIEQRIREGKTKGHSRSTEAEIKHLEKIKDIEHPDSIDNIDNYGQVDTIVSSPPYGKMEMSKKFKSEKEKLAWAEKQSLISGRSVKAVLANLDSWKDWGDDTDNLGNMEHGDIDAIVSSPPYGQSVLFKSFKSEEEKLEYAKKLAAIDGRSVKAALANLNRWTDYGDNPNNLGNMEHGNIDSIITSPPYGAMLSRRSGGDDRPEAMRRVMEEDWGYSPKMVDKILAGETNVGAFVTRRGYNYSADDQNIGNLPTGEIDSVISSPPYEGSLEDRGGTQQKFKKEKGTPAPYSKDPKNIGNKTGETYLEAMFKVYLGCWMVMKEGGIMVIVVKNFVRKGKPVRLDLDTTKLCEAAGFKLADRWWFRLPFRSFWTIQHTKKWSESHPDSKEHPYAIFEDILVFSRKSLGDG